MDESILFFAKFGERKNLEKLKNGSIYFSNAENFRKIEEEQFIKGQGDKYDGRFNSIALDAIFKPYDLPGVEFKTVNVYLSLDFGQNKNKAVFCIMAGTKDNCIEYKDKNHYKIKFNENQAQSIREQFCNADSVLIIKNPKDFIENVNKNIGKHVYSNKVLYYRKDYLTTTFMNFILGGDLKTKLMTNSKVSGFIDDSNVYRVLLCKDEFFKLQQEYRFVLYDTLINEPQSFSIDPISDCNIYDLDSFFSGVKVNL